MADDADGEDKLQMKTSSSIQQMLTSIIQERCRDVVKFTSDGEFELVPSTVNDFWTSLFTKYFLSGSVSRDDTRDDMLFYVRKIPNPKGKFYMKTEIEVYRRASKNVPSLEDKTINWEETVYLNIILHQFEYTVTCAVCTRTSEADLQILKKFSQRVYPSPSRRRMDSKGTEEEITYPNIFFTVDNFEEAFGDIIVRDSEMVCVELTAADRRGNLQGVIFLGSIRYEALKKVYDARASLTSKMVQTMSLGWIKSHKRVEFVRMRGPQSKGHAEVAVSRVEGSGPETPDLENFPLEDFDGQESDQQQQNQYTQRRMSDPSSSLGSLVRGGIRRMSMKKSRSETERVDHTLDVDGCHEVEAGTIQEELKNKEQYDGFLGKSFGQAWQIFKERKRLNSVALNSYLTYITLPWHRIVADVLDNRQKPILLF
ncbi:uncharacterized protein KIAA0930 homolog [Ylistrum balloti]|uniref:uncharacterized protein KIAA0930 homolog n=1 Tax=Ylistrum balloti TaxID=509963 RepID=UPI002905CF08|nr:uncharacterized protein KIAA0930 homolog [Ylistrum balloti]